MTRSRVSGVQDDRGHQNDGELEVAPWLKARAKKTKKTNPRERRRRRTSTATQDAEKETLCHGAGPDLGADGHAEGQGRRATTLRSRVRVLRQWVVWLGNNNKVPLPTGPAHCLEYLRQRLAEPGTSGALEHTHLPCVAVEDVACSQVDKKLEATPLYEVVFRELFASASPERLQSLRQE